MDKKIENNCARTLKLINQVAGGRRSMSFPIPVKVGETVYDAAFFYINTQKKERPRPDIYVLMDVLTGEIFEYRNAKLKDFMPQGADPINTMLDYSAPTTKNAKEQMVLVNALNKLYPVVRTTAFQENLSADQITLVRIYKQVIEKTVPTALMPYYRALSPNFFIWLEKAEG